ncbi:cora-domain-containing protein [Amylocystis lapponica]|nr:cora-domain-containing protein [Amylocystis lapponica]
MYQASVGTPPDRPSYDFSLIESFAHEEKARLGIQTPSSPAGGTAAGGHLPFDLSARPGPRTDGDASGSAGGAHSNFTIPRARHRKLSQSNGHPRRGKMALFEQPGAPPPTLAGRMPHLVGAGAPLSAVPSYENLSVVLSGQNGHAGGMGVGSPGTGHDRPYRFSFYSNALSATIHARSLSELPAEGQTFEDLFLGKGGSASDAHPVPNGLRPTVIPNARAGAGANTGQTPRSTTGSPIPMFERPGGISKTAPGERRGGNEGHSDSYTWWLDVLSPTDEEMKLLSKVFSIHPLTTEDIQMEETREKIELFRNYYLVCFRGFDQDPYSPTHLEPLNMYIIVFREGIISFHFRPTPHPQNVRRRIKQLKDYISVTSDWISYALIDDITDAFGPLIQSIEYEVDSIDELVLILKEAEQSDMLRRIGTCRKKVMGLLRLMGNKADVVKGLAKRCNENWRVAPTSDIGLYLSDIQDHLITMTQNLNHYEKILSRSHSNYLAQISIEMTEANNQINDVLSKLTALGTVLIPMNLVTGLWGMNVHVPGQEAEGYAWFGSIIGALAAFAIIAGYSTYKLMVRR